MTTTDNAHAIGNARAHLTNIRELVAKRGACESGPGEVATMEALDQELDEYPLSVLVRDGWRSPGGDARDTITEEYEILLTTGGPACRIWGELDAHCQPASAEIQWQDWGTPWTPLHASDFGCVPSEADDALLAFAQHFYYGEG